MKLRFIPSKETVLGIITDRVVKEKALLQKEDEELAKLTSTETNIYNPYYDSKVADIKASMERRKAFIADREVELLILDSHTAPRVMVDIEI